MTKRAVVGVNDLLVRLWRTTMCKLKHMTNTKAILRMVQKILPWCKKMARLFYQKVCGSTLSDIKSEYGDVPFFIRP